MPPRTRNSAAAAAAAEPEPEPAAAAPAAAPAERPRTFLLNVKLSKVTRTIAVSRDCSAAELSECISSSFAATTAAASAAKLGTIVALWGQADDVVYPLSLVAADPEAFCRGSEVYALKDPHPAVRGLVPQLKAAAAAQAAAFRTFRRDSPEAFKLGALAAAVLLGLWAAGVLPLDAIVGDAVSFVLRTAIACVLFPVGVVLDALIRVPLHSLYRGGPGFIGWEGAELDEICGRITTHDAAFWAKNPAECAMIVQAKEDALVLLVETLLFYTACIVAVSVGVKAYFKSRISKRRRDLYKAFSLIEKHAFRK